MKTTRLIAIVFCSFLLLASCKSNSYVTTQTNMDTNNKIVATAKKYLGTPYKWAGTNKKGMDCSGLVYTTFLENNYKLPRVSKDQAKIGKKIPLRNSSPGDLLFFKTEKSRKINHVGIVTKNTENNILFIHTSSSKGVVISSMNETYWNRNYQHTQRILNSKKVTTSTNTKTYKVKTGDTLYSISKMFHTTVEELKRINNLNTNNINVGRLLNVH